MSLSSGERPSVLVVDDELLICESIALILSESEYSVDTATSGAEALALAQARDYKIILTDLKMPGMDGWQLAKSLRTANPDQRLMLVTGSPPTEPQSQFDWVVTKPFSARQLLSAVSAVLLACR